MFTCSLHSISSSTLDGKLMVAFAVILSLAAVFSLIALVGCSFAKSDENETSSPFTIGLLPTCNSEDFLFGRLQNNAARKVSLAFAVLAFILGAGSAIAIWLMICKFHSYKRIGFLLTALAIAAIFQLLTLVVLNVCQLYGHACNLASGGNLSVTAASLWIISCTGIAIHSSVTFVKEMPYGKIVLLPAVILSIAAALSFTSLLTCSFVKGETYETSYRDAYYFELGVWPDCAYQVGFYTPNFSSFVNDSKRKISAAFGVIGCFVGTGATIAVWIMTSKKYPTKCIVILCAVIFVTFVFQLVTLTMFQTEYCVDYGCALSTGGKLSVSAAFLWFVGCVCLAMIFQPWIEINLPGKTEEQPSETAQEPRNDVEEMDADVENAPSANIEATIERMEYAVDDNDDLVEHES